LRAIGRYGAHRSIGLTDTPRRDAPARDGNMSASPPCRGAKEASMAWEYSSFEKSEVKGRVAAALFAVTWAVLPGFGVIDLSVTVNPTSEWRGAVPVNAGWGLLTTLLIGGAFVWTALRPRQFVVAAVQLVVAAVALVVSAVVGSESGAFVLGALVLIELAVPATLLPHGAPAGLSIGVSWPLAATAALGAGPWLAYAGDMWSANREGRAPEEITIGINHWAVQGGLALTIALLGAVVALWPPGRRFIGVSTAMVATYLGVCSYRFPDGAGAFDRTWSALSVASGVALAVLVLTTSHTSPRERQALPGSGS